MMQSWLRPILTRNIIRRVFIDPYQRMVEAGGVEPPDPLVISGTYAHHDKKVTKSAEFAEHGYGLSLKHYVRHVCSYPIKNIRLPLDNTHSILHNNIIK